MNSFSFNRFGKTLRWVLAVNFRTLLMWTIGASLAVFLGEMIAWNFDEFHNSPAEMLRSFSYVGVTLFSITSMVLVSSVVSTVNSKQKREAFLMLPSTNLEKYLALVLYVSVVCILCVFLAMVIGDSLRMAWFWVRDAVGYTPRFEGESISVWVPEDIWNTGEPYSGSWVYWYYSALPYLLYNMFPHNMDTSMWYWFMQCTVFTTFIIWVHSLYTLGGTLLRKYAFVATSIVLIVCFMIFVKVVMYFELSMFQTNWENGKRVYEEVGTIAYVLSIGLPLLSILNYWASFHIFKGFQLITNKWTNYDIFKR